MMCLLGDRLPIDFSLIGPSYLTLFVDDYARELILHKVQLRSYSVSDIRCDQYEDILEEHKRV